MKKNNPIRDKSLAFAIKVVKLCKWLQEEKEFVLSKQLLRSGTAIGALVREAEQAESLKDFIHKLSISLKEANETEYWIILLHETNYIKKETFDTFSSENLELIKLLTSIIKTSRQKLKK